MARIITFADEHHIEVAVRDDDDRSADEILEAWNCGDEDGFLHAAKGDPSNALRLATLAASEPHPGIPGVPYDVVAVVRNVLERMSDVADEMEDE